MKTQTCSQERLGRARLLAGLAAVALALVVPSAAAAQALEVTGSLPRTGGLDVKALAALGPTTSMWEMHGEKREVQGVWLDQVLTHFGFEPGEMGKNIPKNQKRKGWRMVVRASAGDGFEAILSCAEIFRSMGATRAMVVWKIDRKPLPAGRGPLRLVVLSDKEPSRSLYDLRRLEVIDLRSPDTVK